MPKKKNIFGKIVFGTAIAAGVAAIISNLEKQAKEEGKSILDVTKEKTEDFIEDVKSGELIKNMSDAGKDFIESVKTGEIIDRTKEGIDKTVQKVKTGQIVDELKEMATNVKDGVVDLVTPKDEVTEDTGYKYNPDINANASNYVQHDRSEPKDYAGFENKN